MKMPGIDQAVVARRAAIAERLRRIVGREWVIDSEAERRPYECDGLTAYSASPLLVVLPETTEQVKLILQFCNEEHLKVVPRGSGTSLSGGALPLEDAVLLVTARMNKILEVDARNRIARVQPGVQNIRVTEAVKHLGLCYMPDPSSQAISTVGGNAAENSGGIHCLKYGVTSNHVTGMEAILLTGDIVHLGGNVVGGADREFDLTGAVIGSEGLLAVITEISVRLVPQPLTARVLSLGFRSVDEASKCVSAIISRGVIPAGLEFMDRKVIDAVSSMLGKNRHPDVEAVLLCELDGTTAEVDALVEEVEAIATEIGLAELQISNSEEERAQIWEMRKSAFGAMGKIALDRLVVMDNVPTRIVARDFNPIMAKAYWFFIFNQIPDLPEALIAGREDLWLGHLFADWCYNPHTISGEAFDTYVKAYRRPGAVRGALADYRANAEDVAQDKVDADKKIACPTLSLWGADFYAVGQMFDMPAVWAEMAENLKTAEIRQCGHLPQEEQPEIVDQLLMGFLDGWAG